MRKIILLALIIVLIILSLILINFINNSKSEEHYVLDCTKKGNFCVDRKIDYTIYDCKPWSYKNPVDEIDCQKTKKNIEKVSYIPDHVNYVTSPFTEELFKTKFFDVSLDFPWDFEFVSDNEIIVTEKYGKIKYIDLFEESITIIGDINVLSRISDGLMGLALDPDFNNNGYLYVQYTYGFDENFDHYCSLFSELKGNTRILNRISRFVFDGRILKNETILIDKIPASLFHAGGRLEFGPDGKLYATTGDATELDLSQNYSFLGGKILRINKDGSIPKDNPFQNSYVYSMGHRNPQGISWDASGELYASEHGPWRYDEINHIIPGENYGWGSYKCDIRYYKKINSYAYKSPIICFDTWTIAPSGIDFVNDLNSPWHGSLFVSSLRGKHLHRYVLDNDEIVLDEIFFISGEKNYVAKEDEGKMSQRIRDVKYWNGSLYVIGDQKGIAKITPILHLNPLKLDN